MNAVFPPGEKFGLIVFPNILSTLSSPVDLGNGLAAFPGMPLEYDKTWRTWLGTILADEIKGAKLVLVSHGAIGNPQDIDRGNRLHKERVHALLWGLVVGGPLRLFNDPVLLTGAHELGSAPGVREVGHMSTPRFTTGGPPRRVDEELLRDGARRAEVVLSLFTAPQFDRLKRVFNAFVTAVNATTLDARLHQFVRVTEGFIRPTRSNTLKQFKSRTELMIGPRSHESIEEIYNLRCDVEHLHDPLRSLGDTEERARRMWYLRRTFQAETLARHCLQRLFDRPRVMTQFENDDSSDAFWRMTPNDRQAVWGPPMADFDDCGFDEALVKDSDLGQ
jgi:hypothetical protein